MTSRRIRAARALSGEAPAAPAELTGVLCFGAHGPPAWLSALTGSWSPGPSTRLTCRGSPMAPGRPPRPRPHKPPRTRSLPPCGKLQIGKAPSGSPPFPTAASALLCSQTPPSDRTASSRARLSACARSPDALRAGLGLWGVRESPGCVAVCWRPPQCLLTGAGLRKAFTLSFMMEEYFPRPTFLRLNSSKTRRICGLQTSVPRKR